MVVPTSYVAHAPAPNAEPHVQAQDVVMGGSEIILVVIVFLIVAGRVIVRVFDDALALAAPRSQR